MKSATATTIEQLHALEQRIAAPPLALLAGHGFETCSDRTVIINGVTVSVDAIARKPTDDGDYWYIALEFKERLIPKAIEQVMRWLGKAHQVYLGIKEPGNRGKIFNERLQRLADAGIGVHFVNVEAQTSTLAFKAVFNDNADTRLLRAAFDRKTCQQDPPAGSQSSLGVKRNTEKRSKWADATDYVHRNPEGEPWKEIKSGGELEGLEIPDVTAAAAKKAVGRDWLGVKAIKGTGRHRGQIVFVPKEQA